MTAFTSKVATGLTALATGTTLTLATPCAGR